MSRRSLTRMLRCALGVARAGAAGAAFARLARAASAAPPVRPVVTPIGTIDVVVPARDEAARITPLLEAVVAAPGVGEVIVVDDQSSDDTARRAAALGARVVAGTRLPDGWAGKSWALQQGLAASTADWVVTFDADARPDCRLPQALVGRAAGERLDLLTVAGRFECPTAPSRWLHAAMLTTLVYRFGRPGGSPASMPRTMANGQCMTVPRAAFLDRGGMARVAGSVVEDVALARAMVGAGERVAFLDASELLAVRMFDSFGATWRGWGRSLALPGIQPQSAQLVDLAVVAAAQALPLSRLVTRRADVLDAVLLLARFGTLVGTRRAYTRGGAAFWLSPLADPLAVVALGLGIIRRRQVWRGRSYTP